MGCDIHSNVEVRKDGKWVAIDVDFPTWRDGEFTGEPFSNRSYSTFAFIANVRNYSGIPLNFGEMPRGIPDDSPFSRNNAKHTEYGFGGYPYEVYDEVWDCDNHSHSYLTLRELAEFNYDSMVEDRRCMRNNSGGSMCEPSEGEMMTYREYLGEGFFTDLEILKTVGELDDVRIVFWFDN
jgi:hypothetical protein